MAAMAAEQGIDPTILQHQLGQIATGFQQIMNTPDTTDGRSHADQIKRAAVVSLANNFSLGCGMVALVHSAKPAVVAEHIAAETGSTINRWYDEKTAMTGYAMYNIIEGCAQQSRGGGKGKKRRYRQKGGAMPDRYDIFTMLLLGSAAAGTVAGVAAAGMNAAMVIDASNYVVDSVISLAVKMGTFKAQCDSASAVSWNLFKQYTVGQFVPVETCLQKIQYNEAQITFIKAALAGLAATLGSVTTYISAQAMGRGMKAVYAAVKEYISIPVVDFIVAKVTESGAAVCAMAARGRDAAVAAYQRRASLRSAASGSQSPPQSQPAEVEQAANAQAQAEGQAIGEVTEELKGLLESAGARAGTELTEEQVNNILGQLKAYVDGKGGPSLGVAPNDGEEEMKADRGGRRRRKRHTRKPRKGKRSKTAKRGRKGKSKRKAPKGKKSRKTRRGTRRSRR